MSKLVIPKIPTYTTKLPTTGETVVYRPITVKEESFLLMAKDAESEADMKSAVGNLIEACVDYPISKMALVDIEWLMIQIRIRSVSEEVELAYRCTNVLENGKKCGARFESFIDLNKVTVVGAPNIEVKITFESGDYVLRFNQPKLTSDSVEESQKLFMMLSTIEQPTGEILSRDDISSDEFTEFLSTFTSKQLDLLKEAVNKFGTLYYKDELVCPVCGCTSYEEYKSLQDFFF